MQSHPNSEDFRHFARFRAERGGRQVADIATADLRSTTMMKKAMAALALTAGLFAHEASRAQCVTNALMSKIEFGYVTNAPSGGADSGAAVVVTFDTGQRIALNPAMNANDTVGGSLIAAIRMAFSLRLRVTVWDHYGGNCDDFDQIDVTWDI